MEACSDRHHCIGGNPCQFAGDCLIGQLCYKEICVPDLTFETLTENSKSTSSATAATSELVVTSTVLITITTPAGPNASTATQSFAASGNATTLTLSTITSAISPVYEPPPTGSKHKVTFLSIPFSILALIVVSLVLYKRWRKNHSYSETEEAHPIVQMRGGLEMPYTVGTPVQFGSNTQSWKKEYRDYRGSAASTLTKVKLPDGEQALRAEKEKEKRASAWLEV